MSILETWQFSILSEAATGKMTGIYESMKIISLDQNVISNLVKQKDSDVFWGELAELLTTGVDQEKLLCPIPKETIVETIPCVRENRIKIRDLQQRLSRGFSFKTFELIEAEKTLALVRPAQNPFPYERIVWHSVENDVLAYKQREVLSKGRQRMVDRMNAFVDPPGRKELSFRVVRDGILLERASSLCHQLEGLINGQPLDESDPLHINLCQYLLDQGITEVELNRLLEKIENLSWDAIPLLFFHAALGSLLEFDMLRGRKYKVNDEIDRFRLSVGLHASDIVITDASMTHLARRLEVEFGMELGVFAMMEHDAIKTELRSALAE